MSNIEAFMSWKNVEMFLNRSYEITYVEAFVPWEMIYSRNMLGRSGVLEFRSGDTDLAWIAIGWLLTKCL